MKDGAEILSSGDKTKNIGGGIIGAGCASLLDKMFGSTGSIIVLVALSIVALVMLFEINLAELFSNVREKIEQRKIKLDEDKEFKTRFINKFEYSFPLLNYYELLFRY